MTTINAQDKLALLLPLVEELAEHTCCSHLACSGAVHYLDLSDRAKRVLLSQSFSSPDESEWEDRKDEWSEAIKEAFPTNSGSHDQYAMAMKMVGNRHSKSALVALVNWLLVEKSK